jgi:hypothetical protein
MYSPSGVATCLLGGFSSTSGGSLMTPPLVLVPGSLPIGSIAGITIGSHFASRVPDRVPRPLLGGYACYRRSAAGDVVGIAASMNTAARPCHTRQSSYPDQGGIALASLG